MLRRISWGSFAMSLPHTSVSVASSANRPTASMFPTNNANVWTVLWLIQMNKSWRLCNICEWFACIPGPIQEPEYAYLADEKLCAFNEVSRMMLIGTPFKGLAEPLPTSANCLT
jgi:hypothetical protein